MDPDTVQTSAGAEVNATVRALVEVALSVNGLMPKVLSPGDAKVIVCDNLGNAP